MLLRPFLEHLAASNLSPKTTGKQVTNVTALGGQVMAIAFTHKFPMSDKL